jgi:S-adenosylmethionine:tRNA ribosyltransferase-isomerase
VAEELQISDYDFDLPKELIAQEPCPARDRARLLVLDRRTGGLAHRHVCDLPDLLRPGDLLVLNDTRVIPARLFGRREKTAGQWEGLFLRHTDNGLWEMLGQTRGRLEVGECIEIEPPPWSGVEGALRLTLAARTPERHFLFAPSLPDAPEVLLERFGHVPIPPYIRKGADRPEDRERYQTVFARHAGSVAAPTAGLHFTPELLGRLTERGVALAYVTLHVGLGTFLPLSDESLAARRLHTEWATLPGATVAAVTACRRAGGRVVAVGTTTVRTLETVAESGPLRTWSGTTNLFIYPPFPFAVVDALVTNFHLPRSSLLMLVSAFAGRESIRRAYAEAVAQRYRFFSYGDAMLIL